MLATRGASAPRRTATLPNGLAEAAPAFLDPALLAAAIGVGLCSSVIPYICDQLAMARPPRATFALLLSFLPVTAALVGALVLRQWLSPAEIIGIVLVCAGVGLYQTPGAEFAPLSQECEEE